jgi:hypothetical protein
VARERVLRRTALRNYCAIELLDGYPIWREHRALIGSPVRRDRRAFLVQPSGHAARAWVLWYSLERKQAAATHNRCVNFFVPIPAIHATVGIKNSAKQFVHQYLPNLSNSADHVS